MPPIYRKIAIYIIENFESVGFLSIYAISEKIGVSTASVMRFSQSLGLDGYADLKRSIQDELKTLLKDRQTIPITELGPLPRDVQFKTLCDNELANLQRTLAEMDPASVSRIADLLVDGERIYTCAFGLGGYLMRMLGFSLACITKAQISHIGGSVIDYAPTLGRVAAGDVVIASDFPPYSAELTHVIKSARARKAETVLFTDSPRCPAYTYSGTVITCENNSLILANSYVGLVSALQVVVNLIFLSRRDETAGRVLEIMDTARSGYTEIAQGTLGM